MNPVGTMSTAEFVSWAAGISLSLSVIVEIAPIKLNPWTYIAKMIGRAFNGELIDKVDALNADLKELRFTVDERNAKLLRSHILKFGDESLHNMHHTKESFDQILQDITEYENYCATHPAFKNDMTKLTTQHIKEVYQRCLIENSFL